DDAIRCIVLTGAGGNFCSGADLRAMAGDAGNEDPEIDVTARLAADPDLHWKALLRSYRPTKPIVAAVEGVAIARGTEILHETDGMTESEALTHEYDYGWKVFQSEDAREGPRAFKEKRKPDFKRR